MVCYCSDWFKKLNFTVINLHLIPLDTNDLHGAVAGDLAPGAATTEQPRTLVVEVEQTDRQTDRRTTLDL